MITEAVIWVFSRLAAFLIGLLPDWAAPDWLLSSVAVLAEAVGKITMLSGWVPVSAVGHVVMFMLACSALALAFKSGRMVLSLATGGGGSAAGTRAVGWLRHRRPVRLAHSGPFLPST